MAWARLLGRVLAALVLAAMGVALPITAAGVIYQGPLKPSDAASR